MEYFTHMDFFKVYNKDTIVLDVFGRENLWWYQRKRLRILDQTEGENQQKDAVSTTIVFESIFIILSIEYHKERDVVTIHIIGAYLHTKKDEYALVLSIVILAEFMAMEYPKLYQKFLTMKKNGKTLLYKKVPKSLYGILMSALLFFKKLMKLMESYGLKNNPYDIFIVISMINGQQMTVTWNMDYLMVSRKDQFHI